VDRTLIPPTPHHARQRNVASGVHRIVASRLVERYGRPTFLVGWDEAGELGRARAQHSRV